jgi:very-short-patch-repair endonuclease
MNELETELHKLNIFTHNGTINKQASRLLTNNPETLYKLIEATKFLENHPSNRARLHALRTGLLSQPKCATCSTATTFNNATGQFNKFCPNTGGKSCTNSNTDSILKKNTTMVKKYGVTNAAHSEELQTKRNNTMVARYGCTTPIQNADIKQKIKDTMMARYGTMHIAHIPQSATKRKETNIRKFGAATYAQSLVPTEAIDLLSNIDWLSDNLKDFTVAEVAIAANTSVFTVRKWIYHHNLQHLLVSTGSSDQRELARFLDTLDLEYTTNDKQLIAPKEVDFYIPSKQLAVEYNGIFYHSQLSKRDKNYHINKTTSCNNNGVRLIQIWSNEWKNKKDIVQSRILHAVGMSTRIYARKCNIIVLPTANEQQFFDDNHIQGAVRSTICFGLELDGKVVACMSFIKSRFSPTHEWELLRYSGIKNHTILGGASKLFKHFVKTHNPTSIVSYCDLRWGTGTLYSQLGFTYSHTSAPNYFYFVRNGDTNKLFTRVNFQKHKLANKLTTFTPEHTEWENMVNNGYDRIWDCGNKVFTWNNGG